MKILIAGFGSIGRRHFRNLIALGERDILFYRTGQGRLADDEIQGFTVETDLGAALAHQPEAVIVANPTALHLPVAVAAAQAGCSLFLEKPISHSLEGIDALQAAVQAGGGPVYVGYQFRFHPGLQHLQTLLQAGAIGRPVSVLAAWGEYLPGWHPWEDYRQGYSARTDLGGGVVLTLSHPLDYLRWLFGEVQNLWAFTASGGGLELDVEDTAEIGLRFHCGLLASLHLDYYRRPAAHWLEITGSQGVLRWDNADGAVLCWPAPGASPESAGAPERYETPAGFERNDLFLAQMRHFLAVARRQEQSLCTLNDGLQALRLALAVGQSQSAGKLINL
jgi:predicted dehydrogenase